MKRSESGFARTEEQELLRKTARQFLDDKAGTDVVRELMATEAGFDEDLWREVAQMGWQGMAIPEEHGGAGYGWVEVALLMEEMGRSLFPAPFLSSTVLGTAALLYAGNEAQKSEHLPALASGEERFTVGWLGRSGDHRINLSARGSDEGFRLEGEVGFVLDGHTATHLILAARSDDGVRLFLVPADADGLTAEPFETLDQTRKQAHLILEGVEVGPDAVVGELGQGQSALEHVLQVGIVALANEQVGGAQHVLDMSVDYATTRTQFGRKIGSFQAIKHRCAEMLVGVESAKSVAYHAASALAEDDEEELAIAAPMAKSYCSAVYERCAGDNIQNHGGIGFTWEHDAHLWFKRAKSSSLLFGSAKSWRHRLANTLEF